MAGSADFSPQRQAAAGGLKSALPAQATQGGLWEVNVAWVDWRS